MPTYDPVWPWRGANPALERLLRLGSMRVTLTAVVLSTDAIRGFGEAEEPGPLDRRPDENRDPQAHQEGARWCPKDAALG